MTPATVRIKNLRLRSYIGFNQEEQLKLQDVVINVRFTYDCNDAAKNDIVNKAVNYRTITKKIIERVSDNHFLLLEKLVKEVLDVVVNESDNILYANVEVDKPHALRFADSVSLSLEYNRN